MAQFKIVIPSEPIGDFCRRNQIRELAIFGSALRDDFRPDSDVDVLAEFEPEARFGLFAFMQMRDELSALFNRPVDLVPKNGLKRVIRDSVLSAAQVIYAA